MTHRSRAHFARAMCTQHSKKAAAVAAAPPPASLDVNRIAGMVLARGTILYFFVLQSTSQEGVDCYGGIVVCKRSVWYDMVAGDQRIHRCSTQITIDAHRQLLATMAGSGDNRPVQQSSSSMYMRQHQMKVVVIKIRPQ